MQRPLSKTQKIATLLLSLGAERSAQILEHLDPDEVAQIAQEIAAMGRVSNQAKRAVLREFRAMVHAEEQRTAGVTFAEQVLERAMGDERAREILQTIKPPAAPTGPAFLCTITPSRAAELIAGEPVQIMALLLIGLPTDAAAAILACLPTELQPRVALQLAKTTPPAPEVQAQLERALRTKATRQSREEQMQGRATLARFLEEAEPPAPSVEPLAPPPPTETTFHDLLTLETRTVQATVQQIETRDLALALRGADQALQHRILRLLPFGRRVAVQNLLSGQHALRLREIADAQDRITAVLHRILLAAPGAQVPCEEPVHV